MSSPLGACSFKLSLLKEGESIKKKKKCLYETKKKILFPWQCGLSQASSSIPYECFRFDFFSSKRGRQKIHTGWTYSDALFNHFFNVLTWAYSSCYLYMNAFIVWSNIFVPEMTHTPNLHTRIKQTLPWKGSLWCSLWLKSISFTVQILQMHILCLLFKQCYLWTLSGWLRNPISI